MPKPERGRTDTGSGSWHAAACLVAVLACSPGAPATESRSNVPEFATVPGVAWTPAGEPGAPSEPGVAAGSSDPEANPINEGNVSVSELDPTSEPEPTSDPQPASPDDSTAAVGSGNADPPPSSAEPPPSGEPASESDPPAPIEPGPDEALSSTCTLEVTVTTAPHGGRYTPRNAGAIWIADAAGSYVKSLDVWGNRRLTHVEAWNAATEAAGVPQDRVDAVTGATVTTHRTHVVSWDCTNHQGELVPDGNYRVYFEMTEANGAGPNHFETFAKGPTPVTLQASASSFEGIALDFQP